MSKRIDILDHGYVQFIESWGSDASIVEAARMSTGKGFLGWGGPCSACRGTGRTGCDRDGNECQSSDCLPCAECKNTGSVIGDEKLLRFLLENKHATPFEMGGIIIEIKAPIFVFREWHRHRTQSYNEMSARYTPLPDENYIPSIDRLMIGSDGKNKQAGTIKGAGALSIEEAQSFRAKLGVIYDAQEQLYQWALMSGVPKELARIHLPVGRYSRMRACANLRNWLAFLSLRSTAKNPAAQWEIRQYADAAHSIFAECFPRTLALFDGGK